MFQIIINAVKCRVTTGGCLVVGAGVIGVLGRPTVVVNNFGPVSVNTPQHEAAQADSASSGKS